MQQPQQIALYESAFRMEMAARCKRAYLHDVKNSSHAVHAAVEVLIRALAMGPDKPAERIINLARSTVEKHATVFADTLDLVIAADAPPAKLDINSLIQSCAGFLRHDAYEHGVRIELQLCAAAQVKVRTIKLRLVVLALLTDAIDALAKGGNILITTLVRDGEVVIEVHDSRQAHAEAPLNHVSEVDIKSTSLRAALISPVVQHLVAMEGGRENKINTPDHVVQLMFPAVDSSSIQ